MCSIQYARKYTVRPACPFFPRPFDEWMSRERRGKKETKVAFADKGRKRKQHVPTTYNMRHNPLMMERARESGRARCITEISSINGLRFIKSPDRRRTDRGRP